MITDDIEHMILSIVQHLIPQTDVPNYTDVPNSALTATIATVLTSHITNITSGVVNTLKTVQTNELALQKISDLSATLTRTVKLNKIEENHKQLLDKYEFLIQKIETVLAHQTIMDTVLSSTYITTRDTPTLAIPTNNLLPNDPSHTTHI